MILSLYYSYASIKFFFSLVYEKIRLYWLDNDIHKKLRAKLAFLCFKKIFELFFIRIFENLKIL